MDTIEACQAAFRSQSHMQPQVQFDHYYQIETSAGVEVVPCDVLGTKLGIIKARLLRDYCEGSIPDDDERLQPHTGWLARMSAPGYLDCTCWTAFATELAAWQHLAENYGDNE